MKHIVSSIFISSYGSSTLKDFVSTLSQSASTYSHVVSIFCDFAQHGIIL